MSKACLGAKNVAYLVGFSLLVLLPGLARCERLTYHEAFVAQGAREILSSGNWAYPTIGGMPWLEKPPLPWWLVASVAFYAGGVTENVARLPSIVATIGLVIGIAILAAHHYGTRVGLITGAIQATTAWTVLRGRLAEADMILACLVTWAIVAFDGALTGQADDTTDSSFHLTPDWRRWRWVFFTVLGLTALVKGIGFGSVLVLIIVIVFLLWQRDMTFLQRVRVPAGWVLVAFIGLSWPVLMVLKHGSGAFSLWMVHVSDRLLFRQGPGPFSSEPWSEYVLGFLSQGLPWTPLAFMGAWQSVSHVFPVRQAMAHAHAGQRKCFIPAGDRLLWVWAVSPVALLTLAPVKNAHYVVCAQVPWSIWSALALTRLSQQFHRRGYCPSQLVSAGRLTFVALALVYGLGPWFLGSWLDGRGVEWGFYEVAASKIPTGMPLSLLYDDWDRRPYESPFGSVPHDLAVRLFYLDRPLCLHINKDILLYHNMNCAHNLPIRSDLMHPPRQLPVPGQPFAVIARERDLPILRQLGHVELIARGPVIRHDRMYSLFQITYGASGEPSTERQQH